MNLRKFFRFSVAWPVCLGLTGWVILARLAGTALGWVNEMSNLGSWACWRQDGRAMARARNVALWAYGKDGAK